MFGHPAFALSEARERHQALIAEADRRRLLAIARQARKARKARRKHADTRGRVAAPGRGKAAPVTGSAVSAGGSLASCRERATAPAR
jgi:hypothetical protein